MKPFKTTNRSGIPMSMVLLILAVTPALGQPDKPDLVWEKREDLNILLPASVRIYETNGLLPDSARVRAMYATIDLRDENLKVRAVGSNTLRETTADAYKRCNAILAINGGYFSSGRSESLLVSDGDLVAPGPTRFTRGAFGLVNRKPEIVWPYAAISPSGIFLSPEPQQVPRIRDKHGPAHHPTSWHPAQAVGGGPVLLKAGRIKDTSDEEGFGGSHLKRHPRTAIGYINDHTLVLMVVDGRQPSSAGVTIGELAQMMLQAGCYEAVNLDGGGSSAMVAAGEVVNVPADIPNGNRRSLRKNASALVLTEVIPSPEKKVLVIDTDSENYAETGIWKNTNHVNFYGNTPSREALANHVNKAVYNFVDIRPDSFQVAAWWTTHGDNTKAATFIIHHGELPDSVTVDQTAWASNGRWHVLGNYYISPGDRLEVIAGPGHGKLVTDAIRLVSTGNLQEQPRRGDLRIAVISDLNSGLGSATYEWQVDSIIRRLPRSWDPDLVLCGGDMVAGMGVSDTVTLKKMWNGFDDHIAKPLRQADIPFAFTIGNHDGLRSYPAERKAITDHWTNAEHQTGLRFVDKSNFPHFYSFMAHGAFFASWDASSSEITPENISWLSEQFEGPEAKNARARFVVGHLPLYSVAQERDSKGNVLDDPETLRSLLERHRVNVYISGHQHAYYPGKRGDLQLLNCGAAGAGPRKWLSLDKDPVNTMTIMDVFFERDTIIYTTYDIKHREAGKMPVVHHHELPSSIEGVNGFVMRHDIPVAEKASGVFFRGDGTAAYGSVDAVIRQNMLVLTGNFSLDNELDGPNAITICKGKHTEEGEVLFAVPFKSKDQKSGALTGSFGISEDFAEGLSAGAYHVQIRSQKGNFRAQLYPSANTSPGKPVITSHNERNTYGIRNSKGLYRLSWSASNDKDGDFISYAYQMASDSLFRHVILEEHTGRARFFRKAESDVYALLDTSSAGAIQAFYHRVIATDGRHTVASSPSVIHLMQSDEPLSGFIEHEPERYAFDGKIDYAPGQGSGALWDKNGRLWLADYAGTLHIKLPNGEAAAFSPLQSVSVNHKTYALKPVNGIGIDHDGNILIASNRLLIKMNAHTGEGIAVWEAPAGERAITSPRVNDKGEIYAMSLFADDPNYVLRQSTVSPGTFDLLRTISLPQRILARTFDMSADGLTLYFPDPGSATIQTFTSTDGVAYSQGEDITSTAAGCNAISVSDGKVFAAVRPSGISGASLHFRDDKEKIMWTLPLPELDGAEARGLAVSADHKTIIICSWDKGGGFYRYKKSN